MFTSFSRQEMYYHIKNKPFESPLVVIVFSVGMDEKPKKRTT